MTPLAPNTYAPKAWDVVGYTYEGNVYCPECVFYTDPRVTGESSVDTRVDAPAPVFNSDEIPSDWTCVVCESSIG
jgi:hypothetical protein